MSPAEGARVVEAARRLGPAVAAASPAIEEGRRLSPELATALAREGLFRTCVPRRYGGLELEPMATLEAIEEISRIDGSAGWCVMIGATTGLLAAYLAEPVAREVYGRDPDVVTGGVLAPKGTATREPSGWRVSGRWSFGSGCQHCAWLAGGSVLLEDGKPRVLPNGLPETRTMLFPIADVTIHDTWRVSGLRGTGSHDIEVRNVFVPDERSLSLVDDPPRETGPLYAFPLFGLLAIGVAAVATGIARRAIDALVELSGSKMPSGSRRPLAERGVTQSEVGQAEAMLRAARAFLYESVASAWRRAESGAKLSVDDRKLLRLAATHAAVSSARAVDLMYTAGGGTSIYDESPLQRCFRDVHVVTQHMMVGAPTFELVGRLFLGVRADTTML